MSGSPPTLELDDEFVLDAWGPGDVDAHRRFALDATAARFLGWTVEEAEAAPDAHYRAVVRGFEDGWRDGTRLSLAIRERASGEAAGAVELRPLGSEAEASYLVEPSFRGHGLAARALDAFLAWAKDELGLRTASLTCHAENAASQRVAERCGFGPIGRTGDELRYRREL